ncbi:MAG: patatin-like phospholipase family protein [Planctomycetes bacterium]|nr:patatin-like phospholipase family protein [Planctomycetota bacterium]MCB9904567.1 patatin-like phospholipase family protein [Planctomycetota bacterium]
MSTPPTELALAFGGGGARGAYQVGLLRHLARRHPALRARILTGVSAGAINAAHLAAGFEDFPTRVDKLVRLWSNLDIDDVFRVDSLSILRHVARWTAQLAFFGGRKGVPQMRGLVDTRPLHRTLCAALACDARNSINGIEERIARGELKALALTATRYDTGQTLTFYEGAEVQDWQRPSRRSEAAKIRVDHVMASSALPFFFPATKVDGHWYGDGGIRLHRPLAPSIHLGATHVLAISTRYGRTEAEAASSATSGYPPPAQVIGILMNAIFLDLLDQDAMSLERVNALIDRLPDEDRLGLRPVRLLVMRPSVDLGRLAADYEPKLPGLFRFLTRRLGTRETKSSDLLSLLMFQSDYLKRLIELGEKDAETRGDEIAEFLASAGS